MSSGSMRTCGCSRLAIRASADSGSPCEPVETSTTFSGGIAAASSRVTISPGGTCSRPRSRATPMLRTIERPTNATDRPCAAAESSTCCTRCTCEAKQATMTRRVARWITESSTGPMLRSGVTKPGTSALVESASSRSTPCRAEPGEAAEVGEPAVQRQLVHLEVAGVQDQAGAGPDRHRERVRDRVVDREELAARTGRAARSAPPRRSACTARCGARAAWPRPGRG